MRLPLSCVCLLLAFAAAHAQDVQRLYAPATLEGMAPRYRPNLRAMWQEDFLARLSPEERLSAGAVTIDMPLVGAGKYPLDFYSDPPSRQVVVPISSVKFVDDMAVAFAWYERMGCDTGPISDYAAVLRVRAGDASGSPLEALGVPGAALEDLSVDDVAQKILKSTIYFVTAHEYAHVMLHHKDYGSLTAPQAQQQEIDADAFALEVMRRIGVPPTALAFFFLIATRLEPSPADFASPQDYERYWRHQATHPVSAQRIAKVADGLEADIDAFASLQADPVAWRRRLQEAASELRQIAATLDDAGMRRFLAQRARTVDLSALRHACQH